MLEALLSVGSKKGYYPNSGPGTKHLLSGDENFGYFGVVTDTEMSGIADTLVDTLFERSSISEYIRYSSINWVKVFYKQKVYYYPITPLAFGFTLHEIIESGLMRGDDRSVSFTSSTGTVIYTSRAHNRRMYVGEGGKSWKLIPKLPTSNKTSVTETSIEKSSEAGELLSGLLGYLPDQFLKEPGVVLCRLTVDEPLNVLTGDTIWDYALSAVESEKSLGLKTWREILASPSDLRASYAAALNTTGASPASSTKYFYRPLLVLDQDQSTTTVVIYPVTQAKGQSDLVVQSQSSGSLESVDDVQELELQSLTTTSDTAGTQNIELDSSTDPLDVVATGIAQTEVTNSPQANEYVSTSPVIVSKVGETADLLTIDSSSDTAISPVSITSVVEGTYTASAGVSTEFTL